MIYLYLGTAAHYVCNLVRLLHYTYLGYTCIMYATLFWVEDLNDIL